MTPSRVAFIILTLLTLSDNPSVKPVGVVGLALLVVVHLGLYAAYPFKRCRSCQGSGHHRAPLTRAYRPCRRCHGEGMRLRTGRKAWNALARNRRNRRGHNSQHNRGT
ncbi:hypothetical protein JOF41_006379 [Saccharothrix coeruleofusca]|uniref:hypothetical protein n=1 Tax=Saccharothrix coeruleofusca TaxID=33919 RepID=UPI0027DCD49E|nr:hypothetical protein [Saccharothrix coeruleofusca]MBP2340201.1 hypothetical protein [Saccharothrix coeruleofusca]